MILINRYLIYFCILSLFLASRLHSPTPQPRQKNDRYMGIMMVAVVSWPGTLEK